MYLQTTRTLLSGRPKSLAMSVRALETPWVEANTVNLPPSHFATLTRRSIWALFTCFEMYVSSKTRSASLKPSSRSPHDSSMGALKAPVPTDRLPLGAILGASGLSASLASSTWGIFSYLMLISPKASSAIWRSVAATAATASPTKRTGLLKMKRL